MTEFYSGRSAPDRGTLFHIRNTFGHKKVKKNVSASFNHVTDLLKFTAHGLVCLLALQITSMPTVQSTPAALTLNSTKEEKREYLERLAREIVQSVWHDTDIRPIADYDLDETEEDSDDDDDYQFCICKEG